MRARTREINIFNMSLIDILCGALGAFCFMVLVMLPSYKPPGSAKDLQKQQADTENLLKELEKLREGANNSAVAQQLAEMLQKLQDRVKQLQGQVNQFAAQNQQLQAANDKLAATNQKQAGQLDMRNPFMTVVTAYPAQELDLYLQSDGLTEDKKSTNPAFDLTQPHQPRFWSGDVRFWWPDHGVTVFLKRDTPVGAHNKVYVKLAADPAARKAATVSAAVFGDGWGISPLTTDVTLDPARFWTLLGTFTAEPDGKMTFAAASQAERDAEWKKLSNGAPPPPAPATVPAAQPSATGMSVEDQKALVDRITKLREEAEQRRQQQSPPASPAQSP